MTKRWRLTRTVSFIKLALMTATFVTACLTGGTGAYTGLQFTLFQVYRTHFKHKRRYLECLRQKRGTETIDISCRARAVIPETLSRLNTRAQHRKKIRVKQVKTGYFRLNLGTCSCQVGVQQSSVFGVSSFQRVLDPTLAPLPPSWPRMILEWLRCVSEIANASPGTNVNPDMNVRADVIYVYVRLGQGCHRNRRTRIRFEYRIVAI